MEFVVKDTIKKNKQKTLESTSTWSHFLTSSHNSLLPRAGGMTQITYHKEDLCFNSGLKKPSNSGFCSFKLHTSVQTLSNFHPGRTQLAPFTREDQAESVTNDDHSPQSSQRPTARLWSNLWGQSQTDL